MPYGDLLGGSVGARKTLRAAGIRILSRICFAAKQFVHKFGAKAVLEGPQVLKCFVYRGLQGLEHLEKPNANWIASAKKTMYRPMHVISSS